MKTVAVVFGGKSAEHEVSIITAHIPIIDALTAIGGFDVWPLYISKDGSWYCDKKFLDLNFFKQDGWEDLIANEKKINLSFDEGLTLVWPGLRTKSVKIDLVFPSMHGTYGEDGSLMGLLRMANVPFVGCDLFASSVAMDKALTKQVLQSQGINVVPFVFFTKNEWLTKKDQFVSEIRKLKLPLFVKPVHLGSSIGISKIKTFEELENAIEVGFHYDDKVLVEEGVQNLIEVTLPIIGNDELTTANVERPLNKTEFFDFQDKYMSGGKGKGSGGANTNYSELPANIGDEMTAKVKDMGKQTYKILGCSGIARVDFLIDSSTNTIFVNEVNTLPGSLYHHNWRSAGISSAELVSRLVALAEERFKQQGLITFAFQSGILKAVGGKTQK